MKVVADLNNTITDRPQLFAAFPHLTIVTGTPEVRRTQTEELLKGWGVKYDQLLMCPFDWSNPREYFASKQWKLKTICSLKPDVYLDDSIRDILAIKQSCPKVLGLLILNGGYQQYEGDK